MSLNVQAVVALGAPGFVAALSPNANDGETWRKPIISKPGTEAQGLAEQLVKEVTQPGAQLYHSYVERYETKLDTAMAKRKQLQAKTTTHRKRENVIQRAIAEHQAAHPGAPRRPARSNGTHTSVVGEDDDYSSDEGRVGNDLLEFIEEQTAGLSTNLPLQPWEIERMKDKPSEDLSLRPGAGASTSTGPSVLRMFPPPKAIGPQSYVSPALQGTPAVTTAAVGSPSWRPMQRTVADGLEAGASPARHGPAQSAAGGMQQGQGDGRVRTFMNMASTSFKTTGVAAFAHSGPKSDTLALQQQHPLSHPAATGTAAGRTGRSTEHTAEGLRRLNAIMGPGGLGGTSNMPQVSLSSSSDLTFAGAQPSQPLEQRLSGGAVAGTPQAVQHGRRAGLLQQPGPALSSSQLNIPGVLTPMQPAALAAGAVPNGMAPGFGAGCGPSVLSAPRESAASPTPGASYPSAHPGGYVPSMLSAETPPMRRSLQGTLLKESGAGRGAGRHGLSAHAPQAPGVDKSGGAWWNAPGHDGKRAGGKDQSGSWRV